MTRQRVLTLLLAIVGTLVNLALGYLIWHGHGASLLTGAGMVLGSVLIAVLSPAAGLGAVMAALPTMHHIWPMPRGSFSLLELAILTAVAGIGLHTLIRLWQDRRQALGSLLTPAQIVVPVGLIVAATAISLLNLADPGHRSESLREVRTVILEPILFLVAARMAMRDDFNRRWAGAVFMLMGAAIGAYGVAQVTFDWGGVQAGDITRATAFYTHPNNLALLLERTLLLTLAYIVVRPRLIPVWILALAQFAGLVATFSRGAIIGLAAGVLIGLLLRRVWKGMLALLALGVAACAAAFVLFPDRVLDAGGSGSEPTRFAIWRSAWHMIQQWPVFGVGPDQFIYQYHRRFVEPMGWPERYTSHPHNLIMDIWLRLGIIGLAAFVVLAIGVAWWVIQRRHDVEIDPLAVGAVAGLVGGIVHGMVDNGFFLPDLATMTWFFIALIVTVPLRYHPVIQPQEITEATLPRQAPEASIPVPHWQETWPTPPQSAEVAQP